MVLTFKSCVTFGLEKWNGDLILLLFFRITHTVILDDPFDDPHGLQVPACSPEPSSAALMVSEHGNYDQYKMQNLQPSISDVGSDLVVNSKAFVLVHMKSLGN
jgi:hypothetical protein